ncbi:MAG: bifunctional diaminohydroxyphosphoribosylaminopyrimidine deaminase/5-amino-6-(5-phosphoribosylamino)uracil reductase RibD [Desulfococcaceae bacterium]|jgi:diaminohydroxyphosphoribosylaminopyrimidine deaminase/5-amino-6-(5-phosphoribosylamino)uracil reductase|nr:bifunctional diaminohydroxyphosphoribosylaminopyrimidine deaminase/5-amino-6-(5-phosphoribosylamino)uracil reductase RibD [Desulfococcaceae bacterium]
MQEYKDQDTVFMRYALELAEKGRGNTSPNPMVGAVLVKNGSISGRGYHGFVGGPHAEVNAINDAGENAKGADLYVTLEPCNHQGRTPPCTHKILESGIRRVFVAMNDPNPDVTGGGNAFLKEKGIPVVSGICEKEARIQNEVFVKYMRTKKPFVLLKCAATLDGYIATRTGDAKWVSGEQSRAYVHELRHWLDGIMVGIGTVKSDNPSLTTRLEGKKGLDPTRIILDSQLSVSPDAKIFHQDSDAGNIIVCGDNVPRDRKKMISDLGARVITLPLKDGRTDPEQLMIRLGDMGITGLLIEGGSRVIASALKARIVDKIMFFYAPKILGGDDGFPICRGAGPERMAGSIPLRDMNIRRFGEDVMVEGYVDICDIL